MSGQALGYIRPTTPSSYRCLLGIKRKAVGKTQGFDVEVSGTEQSKYVAAMNLSMWRRSDSKKNISVYAK